MGTTILGNNHIGTVFFLTKPWLLGLKLMEINEPQRLELPGTVFSLNFEAIQRGIILESANDEQILNRLAKREKLKKFDCSYAIPGFMEC